MATYTDIKVAKTIYDPCPVGYTVPRQNAFSAFKIGYGTIESTTGNVNAVFTNNNPALPQDTPCNFTCDSCDQVVI